MKKYYEVVYEGHFREIKSFLDGYKLGSGKSWNCFLFKSNDNDSFTKIISDWMKNSNDNITQVIIEEDFFLSIEESANKSADSSMFGERYLKSIREIKDATFSFECKTNSKKYSNIIQEIIKNAPDGVEINDYDSKENDESEEPDHKKNRRYSPLHNYSFEAKGKVFGNIRSVIDYHRLMQNRHLIKESNIELIYQDSQN